MEIELKYIGRVRKRASEKSMLVDIEEYRKRQEKLGWDLHVLRNMSVLRPLESFQEHPLLRLTIPLLKEGIQTDDLSVEQFIEIALLLSERFWHVDKYNISCIDDYFGSLYEYEDYDDRNRPAVMREDYGLLDEFVMLLIRYEKKGRRINIDGFRWPCLISREEFLAVDYEKLHMNEEVCSDRIGRYFHPCRSSNPVFLLYRPFMALYQKAFVEEHPFERIYNELCAQGDIIGVMTESGKVSREGVLKRMHLPIALCYIIALDRLTASKAISDKWVTGNVSPQYIDAFRPLWWKCSVCAEYSEVLGNGLDFEKTVQRSLTLAEMETGEKPVMPDDYLAADIFSKNMETDGVIPKRQRDNLEAKPDDREKSTPGKRGRQIVPFRNCFSSDDDTVRDKYLVSFREIAKGGKGKQVGTMIAVAYDMKILKEFPSFEQVRKELGDIGAESGYKRYRQSPDTQGREYEDIKARLLKCKAALEAEQPHPQHFEGPTNNSFK